jgi:hypothetical protein
MGGLWWERLVGGVMDWAGRSLFVEAARSGEEAGGAGVGVGVEDGVAAATGVGVVARAGVGGLG